MYYSMNIVLYFRIDIYQPSTSHMGVGLSMQGNNDLTLGDTVDYMDDSEANPYEVYVAECNKKAQTKPTTTTTDSYTFSSRSKDRL